MALGLHLLFLVPRHAGRHHGLLPPVVAWILSFAALESVAEMLGAVLYCKC